MEKILNAFVVKLSDKISEDDLRTVRDQLEIFFADYEIIQKQTALTVTTNGLLKELGEYLITRKIEGMGEKSLERYKDINTKFLYSTNKPITEITSVDVKAYLFNLKQYTGMKDVSLNNHRNAICAFFKWLHDNDYIAKNPCATIRTIKCEKNTRHGLTPLEMERLRAACVTDRDKAIVDFLYATACRCDEMVNVKLSDIDSDRKEVLLFGKGKKERISYLNARAIVSIQNYLNRRSFDSLYLFAGERKPHKKLTVRAIEKRLEQLGELAGIEVTPHKIRHTTATDAINKGMPIEQVQKLLGHESISTTLIYAEVDQNNVKIGHEKYIV
ncbi:MAG: tyrosine-type recombinase/integrase [Clostridiales bacterium]|nr:tyrosine-type recombinase/integrase [Clostridiales bacterium]MBQ1572711.1 tyrosine-type recombinase/integrase [Clostridiales bacterium]